MPPQNPLETDGPLIHRYLAYLGAAGHPEVAGLADAQVALLGHGYNNRLYELAARNGSFVLKIYPVGREMRMRREYAALHLLKPAGVAPNPVMDDPAARYLDAPVLIYGKVPGRPLQEEAIGPSELDRLQTIWQGVHGLTVPPDSLLREPAGPATPKDCVDHIDRLLQALYRMRLSLDDRMNEALGHLRIWRQGLNVVRFEEGLWQNRRLTFCQADSRVGNILRADDGSLRLVDWEHAGLMDPACDIAGFFSHPEAVHLSEPVRNDCLGAYATRTGDPRFFERVSVYLTILPVQWMARLLTMIHDHDARVAQPWVTLQPVEELWEDVEGYRRMIRPL